MMRVTLVEEVFDRLLQTSVHVSQDEPSLEEPLGMADAQGGARYLPVAG